MLSSPNRPPQSVIESRLGFARRSFYARTGGLVCAWVMFAAVMAEKNAGWLLWLGPTLYCLAWPPLAWWLARRSVNPRDVERLNLLADQFLIGIWMVPMDFSLLPVVLAIVMTGMNTVAGGGLRLLLRGVAIQALGSKRLGRNRVVDFSLVSDSAWAKLEAQHD